MCLSCIGLLATVVYTHLSVSPFLFLLVSWVGCDFTSGSSWTFLFTSFFIAFGVRHDIVDETIDSILVKEGMVEITFLFHSYCQYRNAVSITKSRFHTH